MQLAPRELEELKKVKHSVSKRKRDAQAKAGEELRAAQAQERAQELVELGRGKRRAAAREDAPESSAAVTCAECSD